MRCLKCGEILDEEQTGWHNKCIKKFFGTDTLPELDLSAKKLDQILATNLEKGLSIPGVQKKLSLSLSSKQSTSRLTLVDYPAGFILKPQTREYRHLPEFEYLAMSLAEVAGIKVAPHALIKLGTGYAYITKRLDRKIEKDAVTRLAMEDFCQLSERLTEEKYKGSYEVCGKIISEYSDYSLLDKTELFSEVVFAFLVGNSDLHLKNLSLIETTAGSRVYRLSAAYDILPVRIILPEDTEQLALTVNGKKNRIAREDFLQFGVHIGLSRLQATRIINTLCEKIEQYQAICQNSVLPHSEREKVINYLLSSIRSLNS